MVFIGFEGIGVEEAGSIEADTGEAIVEEGDFCDVEIFGVAVFEEHTEVEEDIADGGAGFEVGILIGEDVGRAEAFDSMDRSEPAGEVHFSIDEAMPDAVEGGGVAGLAEEAVDLGHGGVLVGGADGVAYGFALVGDGLVLLGVGGGVDAGAIGDEGDAADFEEPAGHFEVERVAGVIGEFDQADFDFLVSGGLVDGFALVVIGVTEEEGAVDVLGAFYGDLEEFGFTGGLGVGDGGFVEVADVVEFVGVDDVAIGAWAHFVFVDGAGDMGDVEVAVVLLGGGDDIDDGVHLFFDVGVGFGLDHESGAFHDFVEVGGIEAVGDRFGAAAIFEELGGEAESFLGFVGVLEGVGQGFIDQVPDAGAPDGVGHFDLVEGDHADGVCWGGLEEGVQGDCEGEEEEQGLGRHDVGGMQGGGCGCWGR